MSFPQSRPRIEQFLLVQTGTYQDPAIRPMSVNLSAAHENALAESTQGGKLINIDTVGQVAAQILKPTAQHEGLARIQNGWQCRRFRFIMVVHEPDPFNPATFTRRIFYGYTDNDDASQNYLAPDMRIYFNSETVIAYTERPTPHGTVQEGNVQATCQILTPSDMERNQNASPFQRQSMMLLRPQDIFTYGASKGQGYILAEHPDLNFNANDVYTFDGESMVGGCGSHKYNHRRYNSPARYLNAVLGSYSHALKESELESFTGSAGQSGDAALYGERSNFFSHASSNLNRQDIHSNTFFSLIRDAAGYMERGYVTFRDLCGVFPEVSRPDVTDYSLDNGRSVSYVSAHGDAQHWNGSNNLTVAAQMVGQIAPSILMDNFVRRLVFTATNGHGPGNYNITYDLSQSRMMIENINPEPYLEEIRRRLAIDLLNPITNFNQISFTITGAVDLIRDADITIRLENNEHYRFISPVYTDSLFNPVMTQSHEHYRNYHNDMIHLATRTVEGNGNHSGVSHMQAPTAPAAPMNYNHGQQPTTEQGIGFNGNYDYTNLL